MRHGPAVASALGVAVLVLLAAAVPPALIAGDLTAGSAGSQALIVLSFGGVGLVVARRQPRNAVGWILLAFAVLLSVSNAAGSYGALI